MKAENRGELAAKIARLVQEHGWNQDEFARRAGLNRHTARKILLDPANAGRLRNATIAACARALGLSVAELRALPTVRLHRTVNPYEQASQPLLQDWLDQHPDRLTPAEVDELYSLQGTGGPLTEAGIGHFVERIERRRKLVQQVETLAGTEYLDLLEKLVSALYEQIQVRGLDEAADASAKRR